MRINKPQSNSGFTLVELLIGIGITIIIAGAASPIYTTFQTSSQLNENTSVVIQAFRTARGRSVSRLHGAQHGVYFEINPSAPDKVIVFQGASYATRDASADLETQFDNGIVVSTTLTGDEVRFSGGLGVPSGTGSVTLTHAVNGSRTITLNSQGMAEE